MTGVEL